MVSFKFNPKQLPTPSADINFVDLLPSYLRTDANKKFFNSTFNQLFSQERSETIAGYIGRKPGQYFDYNTDFYISEKTKDRTNYQLEPTLVSRNSSDNSVYTSLFYNDLINQLSHQGAITNDHDRLFNQEYYSFAPNIDLDKFTNYSNYYWVQHGVPAKIVTQTTQAFSDYPGKIYASLPDGTALQNGMRIVFSNDVLISIRNRVYLIEGVGSSIMLLDDTMYAAAGAYDVPPYDTTGYDYDDPNGDTPDYITIQRGSNDGNQWSRRNRWFHVDLIAGVADTLNLTVVQAKRPIIEFARNIQLYNFGDTSRLDVDLVYDLGDVQSITGLSSLTLDGVIVHDNFRILVINDVDPEKSNRVFKIYGLDNAGAISLELEPDGESPVGDPIMGETILITRGTINSGKIFYYNGVSWVLGQQKTSINQAPLYRLYDSSGVSLDDTITYPQSSFVGSTLFQYQIDTNRSTDPILGLQISTDILGKPNFDNTLETEIQTYVSDYLIVNIPGYYFVKKDGIFINHWHKAPELSKQWMNDNFVISEETPSTPISIYVATTQELSGFVLGTGPQGTGDKFTNVALNTGLIDSVTTFTLGNLILVKDQTNGSQNGLYEYVSGSLSDATLMRPLTYENSQQLYYGLTVKPTNGTINANKVFVMSQQNDLDWSSVPMTWENQTLNFGLQTAFTLSQTPDAVSDFQVKAVSQSNIATFTPGTGPGGTGDQLSGIDLTLVFDSTLGYLIGDTLLVISQTSGYQNGIYKFTSGTTANATLTRSTDAVLSTQISYGTTSLCTEGINLNQMFEMQTSATLDWSSIPMTWNRISKSANNIQVQLNGTNLVINQDYILVGNILILSSTLDIVKNDYLQVRTYSSFAPNLGYTGYYDIPLNLEANANNASVTTISFCDAMKHFATAILNQPDFSGNQYGYNNYRNITQNLGLGMNILQHSAPMLKLMVLDSVKDLDVSVSLNYVEGEYSRFYNKFINKINQLQMQGYTSSTALAEWVSNALSQINVGKNLTFPFANNGVGGSGYYIPPSTAFLGITPVYRPRKFVDNTANTPLRVLQLHDGQLMPSYDTSSLASPTNLIQSITYVAGTDTYSLTYNTGVIYPWQIIVSSNNAPLIPAVDYTIQTGIVTPSITFNGSYPNNTIITIEWSSNILDDVILYLENLIYSSINEVVRQSNTLTDNFVNFSSLEIKPGFFRNTEYSVAEWNKLAAIDYNAWVTSNKLVEPTTNTVFDDTNPFTWNYSAVLDPDGNYLPGFWRGIFNYFYDTDRPHTNPWEMLGFSEKPTWWITKYGPPPYTSQNIPLWTDISTGTIVDGNRAGTYSYLARPSIFDYLPVDDQGNLRDPVTIGIAVESPILPFPAEDPSTYMDYADAPFVFGDLGPVEYGWRTSPNYSYGLAETMYLAKPARFVEYFWDTNTFSKIFVNEEGEQFIDTYNGLDKRLSCSDYTVYGENNVYSIIGMQQWISEYLTHLGKSSNYLGNRIRGAVANLAYRAAGFVDKNSIRAVVDSFGIDQTTGEGKSLPSSTLIPSANIITALYKSPSISDVSYSGLLVKRGSGYYEITGYDFARQYFLYFAPITTSSAISVNVGGTQPNVNAWTPGVYYSAGTYTSNNGKSYIATSNHTASSNFNVDLTKGYWKFESTIPFVGGVTVLKYEKYDTSTVLSLPYNRRFFTVQDLANFVYGYEKYLESIGWIFDTVADENSSSILNFSYMLNQILAWIASNSNDDFIIVSPFASLAKFNASFGYVDDLQNKICGYAPVVDRLGFAIPTQKLTVSRLNDTTEVSTIPSNVDQRIHGLKFSIISIEHIIIFDNLTNFDDVIYQPLYNLRQNRIKLFFTRSLNWTGSFNASGFIIDDITMSSNFDKSVNDFTKFYDPNAQITTSEVGLAAKKLFGFKSNSDLTNLLMDDRDQFLLYMDFLRKKGTSRAFESLLRSTYLTTPTTDIKFYEEWAVRLGRYGAVAAESEIELELRQEDVLGNPQIVQFSNTDVSVSTNNIIQIGPTDPRYLVKRFNNMTVNQFETDYITPSLPTAGYALLTDAKVLVPYYSELDTYISEYINETENLINADRIWVAVDENGKDWGMYRADMISTVSSLAAGSTITSPFVITMTSSVAILEDTVIILQNCATSNVGAYLAKNISGATFDLYDISTGEPVTDLTEETYTSPNYAQVFRLHNCRFNALAASIKGNIQNPVMTGNVTLDINGTSVSLATSDDLSTVISKINAASITNITASNWLGMLKLTNSGSYSIDLSPRIVADLGIESTTPINGWDNTNDMLFFDSYPANSRWAITETDGTTIIRQQQPQIDVNYIKFVSLINQHTDIKLLDLMLFNPIQNVLPRNVEEEIDFYADVDPAEYNNGTGTVDINSAIAWTSEKIGLVWWDLSQIRFIDYDQESLTYRANNWGATFPGTTAAIYEWVKSPVTPDQWSTYISTGDGYGIYSEDSIPKYSDKYVTVNEFDVSRGEIVPYYYFWITNNFYIPKVTFRSMSVGDIQAIMQNPTSQGIVWFSPIQTNTFLVSNSESLLDDETILQIGFNDYNNKNRLHKHWKFIREFDSIDVPPADVWQKMKDSLVTFVKLTGTQQYLNQNCIPEETFETMLASGEIVLESSITTPPIYSAYLPVPDTILSSRQAYGTQFRPRQSWFTDPFEARKVFVQIANELMSKVNWVDVSPSWNSTISTKATLYSTPDFTVETLADRDALLINSVPNLFDGCTVYVESDVTLDGHWSLWEYESATTEKFIRIQQQQFNTTDYWETVDWYKDGYSFEIINASSILVFDTIADRNAYSSFYEGQLVKVTNSGDGNWAVFEYSVISNVIVWVIVAKQNGTVEFKSNLYDFSLVAENNLSEVMQSASESMIYIVDGFYNDLSTTKDKNQVVIALIREAYRQNKFVDWAFKTSLISASGLQEVLTQRSTYVEDQSESYSNYLNEAKPYRTKFMSLIEKTIVAADTTNVEVSDLYTGYFKLKFDAVSIHPDATLINNLLSLPEATAEEKTYKQQQIEDNFTAAERIAVFSNQDPAEVLPGAKYRGIDIDASEYIPFSSMFGVNVGYDNSPYDNVMGYDFNNNDLMNVYDAFINGQEYTTPPQLNGSDITIDADKFIQPYLAEGHPDQLANLRVADVLNLSVYTKGLMGDVKEGYDVFPYDSDGPTGAGGYDYTMPGVEVTDGSPRLKSEYFDGDGVTTTFSLSQYPQSNQSIFVFVDGVLKINGTDYNVDWASALPSVVFSAAPISTSHIKILTFYLGGGQRVKEVHFIDTSDTIFDIGVVITSTNNVFATVNGDFATSTTYAQGTTTLKNTEVQITSLVPANSSVFIAIFETNSICTVYLQSYTYAGTATNITNASTPAIPAITNNLVYMNGKRMNPPYTRYVDIVVGGVISYTSPELIPDQTYVQIWNSGTLVSPSAYTVDTIYNRVIFGSAPIIGSTYLSAISGNDDYTFDSNNNLTIYTTATGTNAVSSILVSDTLTVDGNTLTFSRPDLITSLPVDRNLGVPFSLVGTVIVSPVLPMGITATLSFNSETVSVVPTDILPVVVSNINAYTTTTGIVASIQYIDAYNGYLVISNAATCYGADIVISGFTSFGITDGSYINAASQMRTQLGSNYSVTTVNSHLVIKSLLGATLTIVDTVFGMNGTYSNVGNLIEVVSFNANNTTDMRTEVYQGNIYGEYPVTTGNTNSNAVLVDIDGLEQSFLNTYDFAEVKDGWASAGFNVPFRETLNQTFPGIKCSTTQTASNTVIVTSFNARETGETLGFRFFKNVNEQWQYLRISDANTTELVEILRPYDSEIVVSDATVLTQPNLDVKTPGIVFIGSERIYFWQVDDSISGQHKLQQLLRGTSGTPMGLTHYPSSPVDVMLNVSNSSFTLNDHGLMTGQIIQFWVESGSLPSPLQTNTDYYIVVNDKDSFKVATSFINSTSNPPVIITLTTGTGTPQIIVTNNVKVVDAGINQNIPLSQLKWFYTPDGLLLENNTFSDFLKEEPGIDDKGNM